MGARKGGCQACKRRKVKCDQTHPRCGRCLKAGIECGGFAPGLRFIDMGPRFCHARPDRPPSVADSSDILSLSGSRRGSQLFDCMPLPDSRLSMVAFKHDIVTAYLYSKMYDREHHDPSRCGLPMHWIAELAQPDTEPRYQSWNALATMMFGQGHKSDYLVAESFKMYDQALRELRNTLVDLESQRLDVALASITALCLYEKIASSSGPGWLLHANGVGQLLQWSGPCHQKPLARKGIFLEHRITLVTRAILLQQTTFLHGNEWKSEPWEDCPASKLAIDYLVDIGTDIAEYWAQAKSNAGNAHENASLLVQVESSIGELNAWWQEQGTALAASAAETVPTGIVHQHVFPTLLEYDNAWAAFTQCTHNAIRILLLQLRSVLIQSKWSALSGVQGVVLDVSNDSPVLGITSDIEGLSHEILRSLNYCYGQSRRMIHTTSFLFLQDVAYSCLEANSKEAIWAIDQGWAGQAISNLDDIRLLKRALPSGRMKIEETGSRGSSSGP